VVSEVAVAGGRFFTARAGDIGCLEVIGRFITPMLIGNILGGLTLVAALNHAQVANGSSGNPPSERKTRRVSDREMAAVQ